MLSEKSRLSNLDLTLFVSRVSFRIVRAALCLMTALLFPVVAPAAFESVQAVKVCGQVIYEDDKPAATLAVELIEETYHTVIERTETDLQGQYCVPIELGKRYRLSITSGDTVVGWQFLEFSASNLTPHLVPLRLIGRRAPVSRARGVVPLTELRRTIPKEAQQAYRQALKFSEQGKNQEAIQRLEAAITIFPQFAEAWNNLGAQRIKLGQLDPAAEAFERGLEINPHLPALKVNLALVRLTQQRFQEAALLARESLALADSPAAHLILGSALAHDGKELDDAIEHLRAAIVQFPRARLILSQIALRQGNKTQALKELELYLPKAPTDLKQQIQDQIRALRAELKH